LTNPRVLSNVDQRKYRTHGYNNIGGSPADYSFNLFRWPYQSTLGMAAFSKRLDSPARAAALEAVRLDAAEAPQREIDCQKRKDEEQGDARRLNKPNFRP